VVVVGVGAGGVGRLTTTTSMACWKSAIAEMEPSKVGGNLRAFNNHPGTGVN
jgi:hypothetical protein